MELRIPRPRAGRAAATLNRRYRANVYLYTYRYAPRVDLQRTRRDTIMPARYWHRSGWNPDRASPACRATATRRRCVLWRHVVCALVLSCSLPLALWAPATGAQHIAAAAPLAHGQAASIESTALHAHRDAAATAGLPTFTVASTATFAVGDVAFPKAVRAADVVAPLDPAHTRVVPFPFGVDLRVAFGFEWFWLELFPFGSAIDPGPWDPEIFATLECKIRAGSTVYAPPARLYFPCACALAITV